MLLFAVAALDEFASGVPSTGAPDIERTFGLTHAATAVVTFVGPGVVSLVFDPVMFWLAERFGRPRMIRIGLAAIALASFLAALAPGPVSLCGALAIWHLASGAATGLSEATLLDAWPDRQAQTMARWSLLSLVGDFAGPALLGGLALGLGRDAWRLAFAIVGAVVALWAIALALRPFPPAAIAPDDDEPTLWQAARDAIRDGGLMIWLLGVALCDLLDEVLIVFASLRLRELGASPAWQSATIGALLAGGAIGLVALERVLQPGRPARWLDERRLLIASGCACAASFVAWLLAPSLIWSVILIVPVGATAAPLYPLASAQAFARRPGRAGVVMVASHLFSPLALALPGLLGLIADHAGLTAALLVLTVEPIGLVVLAAVSRPPPPATTADRDSRDSRTGDAP